MFTIEQIKTAHSRVRSGADFPAYIGELRKLGVERYETWVADGCSAFFGNGQSQKWPAKYAVLGIAEKPDIENFRKDLKAHQQGKTDYVSFCSDAAKSGVCKWVCDLEEMTCIYLDSAGNAMLVEQIPG